MRCQPTRLFALLVLTVVTSPVPAALDPGFGSGGVVVTSIPPTQALPARLALQGDGRIVVATLAAGSPILRFLDDGAPDAGFGAGGTVLLGGFGFFDVVVQPDGRIVAAGFAGPTSNFDFRLVRLNGDGSLDSGFGTLGEVQTEWGNTFDVAFAVALQPDGKILAGGRAGGGAAVARYLADGTIDTGFGAAGLAVVPPVTVEASAARVFSILVQTDGRIVLVGDAGSSGTRAVLARLHDDGTLDPSFGSGGIALSPPGASESARRGVLRADGSIVTVGQQNSSLVLRRYHADGSPDAGFDAVLFESVDGGASLALTSGDRVVAVGARDGQWTLVQALDGGGADATFGVGGIVLSSVPGVPSDVAVQPDGRLVVAGYAPALANTIALARFEGDCEALPDSDGDGRGDACDPCVGGVAATDARVRFARLADPTGDETLRLKAVLALATPVDPTTDGIRVIVEDTNGAAVVDAVIPGGLTTSASLPGWRVNAAGTRYSYRNKGDTVPLIQGIKAVQVRQDPSRGITLVSVRGAPGRYRADGTAPLRATIVLDPTVEESVACSDVAFGLCTFNPERFNVVCR